MPYVIRNQLGSIVAISQVQAAGFQEELLAGDEAQIAQRCGAAHVAQHSDEIDGALRRAHRRGDLPETAGPVVAERVRAPAVALLEPLVAGLAIRGFGWYFRFGCFGSRAVQLAVRVLP